MCVVGYYDIVFKSLTNERLKYLLFVIYENSNDMYENSWCGIKRNVIFIIIILCMEIMNS